jgi:putative nucleotidyltransferase with HDIG domain
MLVTSNEVRPADIGTHVDSRIGCSPALGIFYSDLISALSFAVDLTEGAVPGHALRTCVLGMRIGAEIGLGSADMAALYYALLLKDIGCSSNAARVCEIVGGDDRAVKNGAKLADWTRPLQPDGDTLRMLWKQVLPGTNGLVRVLRIAWLGLTQHRNNEEMIAMRCERGADIARQLGLSDKTSGAIHALDEHWDGKGYPRHLRGEEIPLLSRVLAVAQHLDVFATERNPELAVSVLCERRERWFDPELVKVVLKLDEEGRLWSQCLSTDPNESTREIVLELQPEISSKIEPDEIDRICEAFAAVVDAKSPFTYRHSRGVADVASGLATALCLSTERVQLVRRAALLHDLGKLAVPNTILDKSGDLTADEWDIVAQHPRLTKEILARIDSFAELAEIAGAHHEKLDGSGYPDGLSGSQLCLEARIIAVADIYQAMTEGRPYRAGMSHGEAMRTLTRMAPHQLDANCVAALDWVRSSRYAKGMAKQDGWPSSMRKAVRREVSGERRPLRATA